VILEPNLAGVPVPVPGPLSAPYWEGTRIGELRYQRCEDCGTANFGPGLRCSSCRSSALVWATSAGRGRVYSWTVVWRPQTPAFTVPYTPAIVRLDEAYDMVSAIVGCAPEDIVDGLAVAVEFHSLTADIWLPFFGPAERAER
jgi:uncharacterized OB-fold protein